MKTLWNKTDGMIKLALVVFVLPMLSAIVLLSWVMFFYAPKQYEERLKLEYSAWEKHTGNPNKLTLDEYRYLPKQYKRTNPTSKKHSLSPGQLCMSLQTVKATSSSPDLQPSRLASQSSQQPFTE